MHAGIFANGLIEDYGGISPLAHACQTIIAVDGGVDHCINLGILPDLVIGDMDSVQKDLLADLSDIKQVCYPREKDESDLELALDYCNLDLFDQVTIFGGLGGFLDHTLGNLYLLPRYGKKVTLATDTETTCLLDKGLNQLMVPSGQRTLSLMPIYGSVSIEQTEGLQWSMEGTQLDHHFVSLSNYCLSDQVTIDVKGNPLLAIFSNRAPVKSAR